MTDSTSFFSRLRQRKIVQWGAVYVAGAWLILEIADFLGATFAWPPFVVRALTVIAAVGFLAALVLAWFHGEMGQQGANAVELGMLVALLVIAAVGVAIIGPGDEATPRPDVGNAVAGATGADDLEGIAVMPFRNLSGDPEVEFFGEGMTEEIIAHLASLDGLLVIARSSVMPFKGATPAEVARELGVAHVLEGNVQRSGDRVRVRATLVDPVSGASVWSEGYDRDLTDVFAIQSEVAQEVAAALDVRVSADQTARMARSPTASGDAHDFYLRGRAAWNRRTGPDVATSIDHFKRALELDSTYSDAWAGLADAYVIVASYARVSEAESFALGLEAADRASELDPGLAGPHIARAMMQIGARPAAEVEAGFLRGLSLSPGYATGHHWYAIWLMTRGRFEEARASMLEAARFDPRSLVIAAEIGWPDYMAGRFEPALEALDAARVLDPDYELTWELIWVALELSGDLDGAATAARRTVVLKRQPEQVGEQLEADLLAALAEGGPPGYWRARRFWLERLGPGATWLTSGAQTAGVLARAGDVEAAFARLDAVAETDPFRRFWGVEPALDPLRGDPRLEAILRRAGVDPIERR
ncbi:MAG: hypothetical protein ABFS34_10945 [Gemmatimonadota bacterium]